MIVAPAVTGRTNVVGLIGWPVSHSISPAMHNAAFQACNLDWCYIPLPVDPERPHAVAIAVRGLAALGLKGANVTVPHKQSVMAALDDISPAARAIGAVNTIKVTPDGLLNGDNTDARGFVSDIQAHGCQPDGKAALLLGAGGSARAIAYGLAEAGCRSIVVANRTLSRAETLCKQLQPLFPACYMQACRLPYAPTQATQPDIIVNCTSLGMTPNEETSPWPAEVDFHKEQFIYDLVYNPSQTRFLELARTAGAQAVGGLGMLIRQGAIAFSIWTDHDAPISVMENAVRSVMSGN